MYHNLLDNTADELELLEMELNMTQLTDFEDSGGRRPIFLGGSPQPAWKNDSTTPPSPINIAQTIPTAYHGPEVRRRLQQIYFPNEGSNVELSRQVNSPVTNGFGSQASNVHDINKVNNPTIPKRNTYVHTPEKMVLREPIGVDGINDTGLTKDYLKDASRDSDLREHKLFYPPMYKAGNEKDPSESSTKKASAPQSRTESKLGLIRRLLAGRTELERACETFANEKTKYAIVLEILKIPVTLNEKYEQLDLMNILTMNQDPSFILQVPKALDTIEKYAQNLLKPIQLRPFSWKVIQFSSEAFQTRVQHLKGGISLLNQLGYVDVLRQCDQPMGLGYIETAVSREAVLQLAVDLCIAKFEVEAINNRSHCHMTLLDVPGNLPLAYQRPSKDKRRSFTNSKDLEKLRGRETEMFRASSVGERPQGTNIHGPNQNIRNTNTAAPLQSRSNSGIVNRPVPSGYEINSDEKFLRQIRIPNAVNQPSVEPPSHNSPYSVRPDDTTWVVHGNLSSPGAARILHEDLRNPFLRMEPRTNSIVFEQPRQPLSSHPRFHSDQMNMRTSSYQQMRVPNPGIRQHSPRTEYVGPEYAIATSMQETQKDIDGTRVSLPLIYQRDSTVAVTPNSRQQRYSIEIVDSQYNPASEATTSPTSTSFRRNSSTAVASSVVDGRENVQVWPPTSKNQDQENGWNCKHCTYLNPYTTKVCQICDKTSWVKELGPEETRKRAELNKVEDYFKIPENQLKYVIFPHSTEHLQNLVYHHPPNGVDVHSTIIGGGSGAPLFQSQAQPPRSPQSPSWFNPGLMMPLETGKQIQAMRQMQNRDNIQTQSSQSGTLLRPGYGRTYDGSQGAAVPNPGIASQMSTPNGEQTMQAYQRYMLKKKKESVEKVQRLKKEQEKLMNDAKYVVELLKTVEKDGYSVDEFAIAASYSPADPLKWLKECRQLLIEDVVDAFAETCQSLGRVSSKEAKKALVKSSGDFEDAVAYTRERRQKDINMLQSEGLFKLEEIVEALSMSQGDVEEALCALERDSLKPFLDRIWAKGDRLLDRFYLRLKNKSLNSEDRIRMVLAQIGHVPIASWGRANSAVRLIDETDHSVEDCIEAALSCGYFDMAKRFLEHECALCYTITPMGHLTTNLNCQCHVCYDCFKDYVTINLKEKHIRHLICPCCQLPNMDDETHVLDYFNNIGTLIWNLVKRKIIDESTYRLFDIKVRDLTLKKDPNFRWCAHCPENGFIWDDPSRKMICNKCGNSTCFDCEEKWLPQHDGVSCEDFRQWKEANDPEYLREQAANLASQLAKHGIRCPECNFTYDLARGGCMHFHCSQCGYEFCSGCSQAFRNGAQCTVHESCALKGLHAHHPRDCLYYMRDLSLEDLKKLLVSNNVQFDTEEPEEERGNGEHLCHVMEQHETDNGMKDEECQAPAFKGSAGLCEKHYKEYLIKVANDHGIDPLELMDIPNVTSLLRRSFLEIPARENQESDEVYLERLKENVKEKLPLPPRRTQRRQQPNLVPLAEAADAAIADEVADPAPDDAEAENNEENEPLPDFF